jgi:hypothetical protein
LNIKYFIRHISLGKNDPVLAAVQYRFAGPHLGEKRLGTERLLLFRFFHKTLRWPDEKPEIRKLPVAVNIKQHADFSWDNVFCSGDKFWSSMRP